MSIPTPQLPGNALCSKPRQSPLPTPPFQGKSCAALLAPCPSPPGAKGPYPHKGPRLSPPWDNTCCRPPLDPQAPASSSMGGSMALQVSLPG